LVLALVRTLVRLWPVHASPSSTGGGLSGCTGPQSMLDPRPGRHATIAADIGGGCWAAPRWLLIHGLRLAAGRNGATGG
jgi:hypothetical protein